MKTNLLSLLALTIALTFICSSSLKAQTGKKSYTAKVYTLDNKKVKGILLAADDKGIYLSGRSSKAESKQIFITALQIREIKLRRKNKVGTGSTIGLLAGLAIGGGAYAALHSDDKLENTLHAVGAVLVTFTTSAIGGAVSSGYSEAIQINGRNEDYLQVLNRIQSFIPKPKQ